MGLRAALEDFPLETILQLLAATEKTGRLEVRGDDGEGSIGFAGGRLVSADFEDAVGTPALGATFAIARADVEFRPGPAPERQDLSGDLDGLLDRAVEERDRIAQVRESVPSDRARFRLSERAAERAQITLSSDQWRTLLAIDGERDVPAIAATLGTTRLAAHELLAGLARAGLIDVVAPPPDATDRPAYRRLPPMAPIPPTDAGEAVVLRGDVAEFPLETIVQLLVATRKTGRLELRDIEELARLGFSGGALASATAGEEDGDLALGAAFTVTAGEFDFVPMPEPPAANLSGTVDELLDRASALRDRVGAVRALIPSERSRLALSDRATRNPEISLTAEQWRVLLAVNPQRDVTMVAEALRMRRLPAMILFADLIRGGFVDVVPADAELTWPYVERRRAPWQPAPAAAPTPPPMAVTETPPLPVVTETPPLPVVTETPPPPAPTEPAAAEPPPPEPAAADDRLAALSGVFGPAEPTPPPPAWEPPATGTEAEAAQATAAAWRATWSVPSALPEPAWEPTPPAEPEAIAEPEVEAPADVDPRLAVFAAPPAGTEPAVAAPPEASVEPESVAPEEPPAPAPAWPEPTRSRPEPVAGHPLPQMGPLEEAPPLTAQPETTKRAGLFGGLFGGSSTVTRPRLPSARTRAGQIALFANELIGAYNSGRYGKERVEDRMIGLLMRVDEQADPIDRPIPVANERIDVGAIDAELVPEAQAVPYLAALVGQVYDDAERVLGKDKARRGFRDVRDRLFGKDHVVLQAPEVAARMPKV